MKMKTLTFQPPARTLRNVLHFLVDIGDVCNDKLGAPYRKCRALFSEAHTDCAALLVDFDFLCDIITTFLPLCSLARGALLSHQVSITLPSLA